MTKEKLVSVCISCRNGEKTISKTLDSVLAQTYKNFQIIVIDDASDDGTYEIVKEYMKKDDRIEFHSSAVNLHIPSAFNEALKYAKGDYIAHLDSDDVWYPQKTEKQIKIMEESPEYGVCFSYCDIINENDVIVNDQYAHLISAFSIDNMTQAEFIRLIYDTANRFQHNSALIRASLIKEAGVYDGSLLFLQDFDLWTRYILHANFYVIKEPLVGYRMFSDKSNNSVICDSNGHDIEYLRIIYNLINNTPADLLVKAFGDLLHIKEHTFEELEIERAFLLLKGLTFMPENPILGILKFSQLFKEPKYIQIARDRFNFTPSNFFKLQSTRTIFNQPIAKEILLKDELLTTVNSLKEENLKIRKDLHDTHTHVRNLEAAISALNEQLKEKESVIFSMENSTSWKVTAPLRKLKDRTKK